MDSSRKFTFGYILGKDSVCYGFNVNHKKQISIRVFKDLHKFIVNNYNGTFTDFVDNAMREYVQNHSELFIEQKYKK